MILKINELSVVNSHVMCTLQTGNGEPAGYFLALHPTVVDELKKVMPRSLSFQTEKGE